MTKFHITISFEGEHPHEVFSLFHGLEALSELNTRPDCIEASIAKGFDDMANLTEAQVARLETDLNTLGTDIGKAIDDPKAKIASGGDPQPLLDRIDAAATGLENLDLTVKAGDPGPAVVPVPPTPPVTSTP